MSLSKGHASGFRKSVRVTSFYLIWSGLICCLYFSIWILYFAPDFALADENPMFWFWTTLAVFAAGVLAFFSLHLIVPVLAILFFKAERLRNPKLIIQLGERFRKIGLSAPQVYLLSENHWLWLNHLWGFFILPQPFGSLLLLPKGADQNFEEFDLISCFHAVKARYHRLSSPVMISLTWIPASIFSGFFVGQVLQTWTPEIPIRIGYVLAFFFLLLCIYSIRKLLGHRKFNIDFRAIRIYGQDPNKYYELQEKIENNGPKIFSRLPGWLRTKNSTERKSWFFNEGTLIPKNEVHLPLRPLFLALLKPGALIANLVFASLIAWVTVKVETVKGREIVTQESPALPIEPTPTPDSPTVPIKTSPNESVTTKPTPLKKSDLSVAVESGDMRKVISLVSIGHKLSVGDPALEGATPLLIAAKQGDLQMVFLLLTLGSKINEIDQNNQTVVYYGAMPENREIMLKYLIQSGALDQQSKREPAKSQDAPDKKDSTSTKTETMSEMSREVAMQKSLYDFQVSKANNEKLSLSEYKDKVVLIVNVASKCGFTPQYEGLEKIYKKFKDQGFVVMGFPCNQFGAQEPGDNSEIQNFCKLNYGVTFPIMGKIEVNGKTADPLYSWLKSSEPGVLGIEAIKWNFTKFLVGKNGKVIKRYAPQVKPEDITADIETALK